MQNVTFTSKEVADGSLSASVMSQRSSRNPQVLDPMLLATDTTSSTITLMSNILTP